MKKRILYTVILVLFTSLLSVSVTMVIVDSSGLPENFVQHKLKSQFLNETRRILVNLPANYDINKNYPVVYILGGSTLTFNVSYDMNLLNRIGKSPEVIIVGLLNGDQKSRQRDLTPPFLKQDLDETNSPLGMADQYLKYIEEEVIPFMERNYKTNSERLLIGHSREGLFVTYSLIKKPELFNGRIALSPAYWRENNKFVSHFNSYIKNIKSLNSYLFVSMGEKEVKKMKNAFDLMVKNINNNKIEKFTFESFYMPNATHSDNHILTAPIGIINYFNKNN